MEMRLEFEDGNVYADDEPVGHIRNPRVESTLSAHDRLVLALQLACGDVTGWRVNAEMTLRQIGRWDDALDV